jgi:hypothetical protein
LANVFAALSQLGGGNPFNQVRRALANPAIEAGPLLGMTLSRLARDGAVWTADLDLQVQGPLNAEEEKIVDLTMLVHGKISELIASGGAGGAIDRPAFEFYGRLGADGTAAVAGAQATLRIRVKEPLEDA